MKKVNDIMRIDCWDLETTNLRADFGHILVAAALPVFDGDPRIWRLDDKKFRPRRRLDDDSKLVASLREYLNTSFWWVGWNSKMFDVPFLQTRLLTAGFRTLDQRMHTDLMYYARRPNLILRNSKMETVATHFKLKEEKTHFDPDLWNAAYQLDKAAMDLVVEHCIADTKVLRELFYVLSPFIRNVHR